MDRPSFPIADFGTIGANGERIYSIKEVAKDVLECDERTVRQLIEDGELQAFDITPRSKHRTWRVPEGALRDYMAKGAEQAHARAARKAKLRSPAREESAPSSFRAKLGEHLKRKR